MDRVFCCYAPNSKIEAVRSSTGMHVIYTFSSAFLVAWSFAHTDLQIQPRFYLWAAIVLLTRTTPGTYRPNLAFNFVACCDVVVICTHRDLQIQPCFWSCELPWYSSLEWPRSQPCFRFCDVSHSEWPIVNNVNCGLLVSLVFGHDFELLLILRPAMHLGWSIVNNNNGYFECLTCTGPKRLHILWMHIFSKFSTYS